MDVSAATIEEIVLPALRLELARHRRTQSRRRRNSSGGSMSGMPSPFPPALATATTSSQTASSWSSTGTLGARDMIHHLAAEGADHGTGDVAIDEHLLQSGSGTSDYLHSLSAPAAVSSAPSAPIPIVGASPVAGPRISPRHAKHSADSARSALASLTALRK